MGADDSFDDYVPPPEPAADYGDFSDSDFDAFQGNSGSTRGRGGRGGSSSTSNRYSNFNRGSDELQEYRTPPHDELAERSVIGAMLLNPDVILDVAEGLRPDDFYFPAHQLIYQAILDLFAQGSNVDVLIVAGRLDRINELERVGGAPYLHTLISEVPTAANARYYADIVGEKSTLRQLVDAGTRVARFMLSDALGNFAKRFRDPSWTPGAWLTTAIMVGAWGSILLMGVTDPLGGINTLFPLFGISNQLLAAIALAVIFAIVCKMGLARYAWIPGIPLAWDLVVTMTASWQKIFSSDPKLGYWAQHFTYRDALAAGETSVGATQGVEAMNAVVRNTFVQGTLSIVFALLVAMVVVMALWKSIEAIRKGSMPTSEEPFTESKLFAPAGLIARRAEREVQAQWEERSGTEPRP